MIATNVQPPTTQPEKAIKLLLVPRPGDETLWDEGLRVYISVVPVVCLCGIGPPGAEILKINFEACVSIEMAEATTMITIEGRNVPGLYHVPGVY